MALRLRWLAAGLPFALLLADTPSVRARRLAEFLAAMLGYGAAAMLVPGPWLPIVVTVAVLGLAWRLPNFTSALATLPTFGTLWAAELLAEWTIAGLEALSGEPFLLGDLPSLASALRYIAPLATGLGATVLLGGGVFARHRRTGLAVAASLALVVIHVCYKQFFEIADLARFAEMGLAERTVWQALLTLAALGLAKLPPRRFAPARAGTAVALIALVHFTVFSLFLHNPLWTEQSVGAWPIANMLLPSFGIAIGLVFWLRPQLAAADRRLGVTCDAAAMVYCSRDPAHVAESAQPVPGASG